MESIGRSDSIRWVGIPNDWPSEFAGGLSIRQGGVSESHFASLNLGTRTGDRADCLTENLRRLCSATGLPLDGAARIRLEHGATVLYATGPGVAGSGDGLVTCEADLPIAVTVADCFPLLFALPGRGVALAHCGWRGVLAGVAVATAERLARKANADVANLLAWIGPGIQACCFRLPAALAMRFEPHAEKPLPPGGADCQRVNLAGTIAGQLQAAGLSRERIRTSQYCTFCCSDMFFSHRRDQGRTGRMLAWIVRHGCGRRGESVPTTKD